MVQYRDVSWIVQKFRSLLLGREWTKGQLRRKPEISNRSPPHPMIPDGPAHRLSANYYVNRDTRRLVMPPRDLVNAIHDGKQIPAKVGQTLMSAAIESGVEIEAACEGSCACSTCHVYIKKEFFDKLEPSSDKEEDMLDLALFVEPTSRLSCQVIMTPNLHGLEFELPKATRNFYAGKKSTPEEVNNGGK